MTAPIKGNRLETNVPSALGWRNALIGIRDLARHLDISIGTVSRALNDRADVNSLTRQRVRDAAAKLGYSPNQSGRSLRRGRRSRAAGALSLARVGHLQLRERVAQRA